MIHLILLVLSFLLFLIAGFRPAHPDTPRFLYFGLALWVLSILLGGLALPVAR
jgi:hypothetical protein